MAARQVVRVFNVQDRRSDGRPRPWLVRWEVDARRNTRSFKTKARADRFRSELLVARHRGDRFDRDTGEPVDWAPSPVSPCLRYRRPGVGQ
jgi:hypothetical protein